MTGRTTTRKPATCAMRTRYVRRYVDPRAAEQPHKFTAKQRVAGVETIHCTYCWKRQR